MFKGVDMNRRDFLWLTGVATGSVSFSTLLSGCAFDPVTGDSGFSLVSEAQEIELDQKQSPHQFTADYGANNDAKLNNYVSQVGSAIAKTSHRPQMPYNYRVLDANHVNAYTFPAGSMGITRGILVEMESEAELAALLGHEIGHVNARHASERATKGILAQAVVGLASSAVGDANVQQVVSGLGSLSATALLAKYSRDNEREADTLGMDYAVLAGANPKGMVKLMDLLNSLHSRSPGALEIMFSSHPMSNERLKSASGQMDQRYRAQKSRKMGQDRYMDYTAELRKQKAFIKHLANADMALASNKLDDANTHIKTARGLNEQDYGLWVITAKQQMASKKYQAAESSLKKAMNLKPKEQLPNYLLGANYLEMSKPEQALVSFGRYKKSLPGNPSVDFFIGYSYEKQEQYEPAAQYYRLFLKQVSQGAQAEHAYKKLQQWG
jgi:predicted Zn-dependent protease